MTKISIGDRFGRLTITGFKADRLLATCDCGATCSPLRGNVKAGRTVSCGCRMRETCGQVTHGQSNSATYKTWENMHNRCNPNNAQHTPSYVGITVCKRWSGKNGFENFLCDMSERPVGLTLDRRDNAKGYSKDNCRWATRKEQQNNLRINRRVNVNGVSRTVGELASMIDLSYMRVWHYINSGAGSVAILKRMRERGVEIAFAE